MDSSKLTDLDVLALTLWAEARSESILGRVAVGCVIRNRMHLRKQTAKQVCLSPMQFSCWQTIDGKANYDALAAIVDTINAGRTVADAAVRECYWIARGILDGDARDVTKGADHYLTTRLLSSAHKPGWLKGMEWTTTIENHAFYRSRS